MAPHVKWFFFLISGLVVLNDKNAAKRIITTSISEVIASLTSPNIGIEITSPAAFWKNDTSGSTPLNITATTIITMNIILCNPSNLISGSFSLISGI